MERGAQTDAQLLRAPEPSAFGELYERHVHTIYRWLARRGEGVAADLTAETFAQAWLSRRRFRDRRDGSAVPWLLGIAQNIWRESLRKDRVEARARQRLGLPTDLAGEELEHVHARLSPRKALLEAVAALPEHERDALRLRVVDELPYAEVARRLEIQPGAARLRVSRALRRLALLDPKEEL